MIQNFGANVAFEPAVVLAPRGEEELLTMMAQHRGKRWRAVGRLHCWSEAVVADEVLVDLRHLNDVQVDIAGSQPMAEVGAGCQIKHLLDRLRVLGNYTTPSLGLITEQTIAGATATGTHGSGRHSLSHYIAGARVAMYDPATQQPTIRVIDKGAELQAVRCSLGCLGIVTAVRLPVRPQYQIEEHFARYATLAEVLAAERDYPLQQFYLAPWRWDYFAQHRRESDRPRSWHAPLYRGYWSAGMDVAFHLLVRLLARQLPAWWTKFFFRHVLGWLVPRGWRVVDRADRQLTMEHELFRHIEIEMFVKQSQLTAAIDYVIWLLERCGGAEQPAPGDTEARLRAAGLWPAVEALRGKYCHHYPICIRKVLPDDTLISMASGDEAWYALSFISYASPDKRGGFFDFAAVLAETMDPLFAARPHWGKYCPLAPEQLTKLYPEFARFRTIAAEFDPEETFANAWCRRLLKASSPAAATVA